MTKRYLGGLISTTAPSVGVLSAPGIYSISQQVQYQNSNTWPRNLYSFPTVYQSLITGFSGTVLYVDASIGNDTNNGTSMLTPYATVDKAQTTRTSLSTSNVMIVIRPGTYTVSVTNNGSASYAFFDISSAYYTVYVCAPGKTILNFTSGTARDGAICAFNHSSSAMYGAILNRNNNGKTLNYSTAFFNNTTTTYLGSLYNCVISEVNPNNIWAIQYDNSAAGTGKVDYCSFYVPAIGQNSYGGSASFVLTNSVFNYGYGTDLAAKTTDLTLSPAGTMTSGSATPPYVSPGTTTQGVYYGTYSWSAV